MAKKPKPRRNLRYTPAQAKAKAKAMGKKYRGPMSEEHKEAISRGLKAHHANKAKRPTQGRRRVLTGGSPAFVLIESRPADRFENKHTPSTAADRFENKRTPSTAADRHLASKRGGSY